MFLFCLILGVLCLLYFFLLLLYSGFTSAFYLVWPFLSAVFLGIGWLFRIHFWKALPFSIRAGLLVLASAGLLFFLGVEGMILRYSIREPEKTPDFIIVLGAHVKSSGPSRALALRLDKACEFATLHPDTILIVSGGKGGNEPVSEASVMKDYLIAKGIEPSRILKEDQSTNTRENLLFSQKLIPEGSSVGIISNGFHICRALHLAEKLGIEAPVGIPAKNDLLTQPANLLREFFAVVKDFWLLP